MATQDNQVTQTTASEFVSEPTTETVRNVTGYIHFNNDEDLTKIFETLLTRKYNHEFMAMMLDQLDKKERGKTTQHDASVAVGTLLVDRIVKPQLAAAGKKV